MLWLFALSLGFPQTKGPAGTPWQDQGKTLKKIIEPDCRNLVMAPPAAFSVIGDPQGPAFVQKTLNFMYKLKQVTEIPCKLLLAVQQQFLGSVKNRPNV